MKEKDAALLDASGKLVDTFVVYTGMWTALNVVKVKFLGDFDWKGLSEEAKEYRLELWRRFVEAAIQEKLDHERGQP